MPLLLLVLFWTHLCNTGMIIITFRYSLLYPSRCFEHVGPFSPLYYFVTLLSMLSRKFATVEICPDENHFGRVAQLVRKRYRYMTLAYCIVKSAVPPQLVPSSPAIRCECVPNVTRLGHHNPWCLLPHRPTTKGRSCPCRSNELRTSEPTMCVPHTFCILTLLSPLFTHHTSSTIPAYLQPSPTRNVAPVAEERSVPPESPMACQCPQTPRSPRPPLPGPSTPSPTPRSR
jgi:hypothetical protein